MSISSRAVSGALATCVFATALAQASCTCGTTPEVAPANRAKAEGPTPVASTEPEPEKLARVLPGPRNLTRSRALFTGTSEFSKMRVVQSKSLRTLEFIKDGGKRMRQSVIDVTAPHVLQHPYSHAMFGSLVLRPQQDRILIVGLGGGAMIHFFNYHFPETKVDVVEIDPVVVQVAREWFGIDNDERNTVATADGVAHIEHAAPHTWDVIYMDAFLKPTADQTTSAGIPESTVHRQFLERLRKRLKPGGLLVFHMHHKSDAREDIDTLKAVFPNVRQVQRRGHIVVYASGGELPSAAEMETRATELDNAKDLGFSMRTLVRVMVGTGLSQPVAQPVEHPKPAATDAQPTPEGALIR